LDGVLPTPATKSYRKLERSGGAAMLKETLKGMPEEVQEAQKVKGRIIVSDLN
jgi:hypothetical protein